MSYSKLSVLLVSMILSCSAQQDVAYLFSHGLGASGQQAKDYMVTPFNAQWIIQEPLVYFDFPDGGVDGFKPEHTSLGQDNEIQALKKAYEQTIKADKKVILMGLSRGASTALNLLGTQKTECIVAGIFESPFDSIVKMLKRRVSQHKLWWIPQFVMHKAPELIFKKYKSDKQSPIDCISRISPALPLLFICSLEDTLIDAEGTCDLYLTLKKAGYEHVYLLLLNKGAHAQLLWHNDREWYVQVVHAFYEKYNLPYEKEFAEKGRHLLAQCQPDVTTVTKALQLKRSFINEK